MASFQSISLRLTNNEELASRKAIKRLEELSSMQKKEVELDAHFQSIVDGMKQLGIYIEADTNGKSDLDKLFEDEQKKILADFANEAVNV
tara:strand:- start:46606 stop:46875 length:270 start_codon:yes stop_codon:yes gene_type:complete